MQSFCRNIRWVGRHAIDCSKIVPCKITRSLPANGGFAFTKYNVSVSNEVGDAKSIRYLIDCSRGSFYQTLRKFTSESPSTKSGSRSEFFATSNNGGLHLVALLNKCPKLGHLCEAPAMQVSSRRVVTTMNNSGDSAAQDASASAPGVSPRIKFKRLDKTAKHIMQILDKEAVEEARAQREIPDIKPGYIIQLKVEVPDNKRRVSIVKGIVIARRNAGINTTFRLRRLVAGVGVESLFPLYSPNIKEIKVLDKKKVRRAKLYYLRDKLNALKK
ncbi:hypothetical protein NMG60_11004520 [Bertholletia excelsa]